MKKNVRSLLVLLCAALLLCAAALPAFAAGETTGSITIDKAVDGETYDIYRIFDLESYKPDTTAGANDGKYSYKLSTKWNNAGFASDTSFTDYFELKGEYVYPLASYDQTAAAAFAAKALAFAKDKQIANDGSNPAAAGSVSFSGLQLGYYLVDTSVGSLCSLTTTDPSAKIEEKNEAPTIDKKILSNGTTTDTSNAKIGDSVNYQVTIHAKKGATGYILTDTLSAGLTFNNDVKVTMNGNEITAGENTYSVVQGTNNDFTVTFAADLLNTITADTDIIVTYSATLNEKAADNNGVNTNKAQLTYGNNAKTTEKTTSTYTYKFDLVKTDSSNKLLAGAFFKLYTDKTAGTEIPLKKIDSHTYRVAVEGDTASPIETVSDGKITIQGLGNGTYWLEETQNPEGYNKLEARVEVALAGGSLTSSMTGTTWSENDSGVHIINQSGTVLPGTGGRGTTLFYVVGGGLMFAAIVLLVAKKRMEHKD